MSKIFQQNGDNGTIEGIFGQVKYIKLNEKK